MSLKLRGFDPLRVPGIIRIPLILVAVGLPLYWMFTESGLYYWLRQIQADLFNGYHVPILSVLIGMLLLILLALIIILSIAPLFPKREKKNKTIT